jgi:predicted membrane protein (TIGR00267 family)
VISPFFLANFGFLSWSTAFLGCIGLTLTVLTLLGIYLARISDESMIKYGLQMLLVGIITALLCVATSYLLGGELVV